MLPIEQIGVEVDDQLCLVDRERGYPRCGYDLQLALKLHAEWELVADNNPAIRGAVGGGNTERELHRVYIESLRVYEDLVV